MAPLGKKLHRVVVFVLKLVRRQHKTFVSTFSLLVLSFATIIWRQRSWKRLPPGPWGLPVVGILPHIMAVDNPGRKIRNMSQFYGQIFCARLGNHRAVFLNSLEMMKESIKQRERMFGIDEISHGLLENINFKFGMYMAVYRPTSGKDAGRWDERSLTNLNAYPCVPSFTSSFSLLIQKYQEKGGGQEQQPINY